MTKLTNVISSNLRHKKLMKENLDTSLSLRGSSPLKFITSVNAFYHAEILEAQEKENKIISYSRKKELYKKSYDEVVRVFKFASKHEMYPWWTPSKNDYFVKINGRWKVKTKYPKCR